ncbi:MULTISPECIES: hypothetical protein [unclassified Cryobacterium]|uniref:hypothetical protein n=1 Tax=unclassified Cryobacterium TaxID=2649013 RepID=UPI002AB3AF9E|nr:MULTISPECIES: hypothetical protein [unclassified Cryobacterium]MDY7543139.1 hypothetical protein [Cryobacterium sp. 5B3]MEA9998824.1 hypothetical protein [Cryobacterium sp. RTS3]MEB0265505.1 hypothetical protein [Cryobacterium sp. 10I5]MEB0275693.1 hypothetical protein [Cryobacterium sp. 5B3]
MTLFESDHGWPPPPARRPPRWRLRGIAFGLVIAGAAAAGLVLTALPSNPLSALTSYSLSTETAQIADRIGFSDEGREIFLATHPQLLDSSDFRRVCDDNPDGAHGGDFATVGCYYGLGESFGRIAIFRPGDARLADQIVVTAAHEFLHAAYARLTSGEQARLDALLDTRWSTIAADDPIQASVDSSVGSAAENRSTEEFAYFGTEIADAVDPALEAYYAPYFRDRGALVAIHDADRALWDGLQAGYSAKADALAVQEQANADASAQLQADRTQLAADRDGYNRQADEYNALSPEVRARTYVADSDATSGGEPYGSYLAGRLAEFATRESDQSRRRSELDAAEAAAPAARTEVERLYADFEALTVAAVPAT